MSWERVNADTLKVGDKVRWRGGAVAPTRELEEALMAEGRGYDAEVIAVGPRNPLGRTITIRTDDGMEYRVRAARLIHEDSAP